MSRPIVIANWKMHGTRASVDQLASALTGCLLPDSVDVVLCPGFVHLPQVLGACENSLITVGAQDCSHMHSGAYTGEVAADMLTDIGCQWVLLGHSERRQYHAESDDMVAAKLGAAIEVGLRPVLCIGETREQRENGEAFSVVASQLEGALAGQASLRGLVVAYEPVWAIGSGLTATPDEAQEMHAYIRQQLAGLRNLDASATRVLYGGSVKAANAATLFEQADIDGALVGGASLNSDEFAQIIAAAAH
ncbi:MAG: triose-phosphate isomerase [Parahaliea sp.]